MGVQIKNLDEMIYKSIGNNKKIIETKIANLTNPGDNYGSQMYRVDLRIKNEHGDIEDLHVVAKQIPDSEFYQQVFHIQVTFNMEKEFYNTIVPTMHAFQKKNNVPILDSFPKFYGARNNLNSVDNLVDKDGLIILENLKAQGYINLQRTMGFDIPTSKLILEDLARFHATVIALKLKDPETFKKNVKPYCGCFQQHPPRLHLDDEEKELASVLEESEIGRKILPQFRKSMKYMGTLRTTFREPFATVVHRDFWVNNIMLKMGKNAVNNIKIVDFQMYTYDSPATDLMFFLFTSVQTEDLTEQNFEGLIEHYHEIFAQILLEFGCDIALLSYEKLIEEIKACMETELAKMIFMLLFIIRGPKGGHSNEPKEIPKLNVQHLRPEDKDRLFWLLEEFDKRGWINF